MMKKMFVGGLPYDVTESRLTAMFAVHGKVVSAKVIMDRETGRSKGFGFVEMSTDAEAEAARAKLNNSTVGERRIVINEARPMEARPRGGFGGKPSYGDKPSFGDKRGGFSGKRGGFGGKGRRGAGGDGDRG
ncbi:MAG TPA: RNA-binding protein [Elusimicrobia bacterium]|nr:RNA-binding protein [Elusimicrobiota bacterium]